MTDNIISVAFNAYKKFIKQKKRKELKIEILEICLQYIEKYRDEAINMLRDAYPRGDPEHTFNVKLQYAENRIKSDIASPSIIESQPPSVFPVSGMNMAPSGPSPAARSKSQARPKRATRRTEETDPRISGAIPSADVPGGRDRRPEAGDPRVFGPPGGNVGASLMPLIQETKNKLPLPYYDTENDPYVFQRGK
jgi:hypothetical protein